NRVRIELSMRDYRAQKDTPRLKRFWEFLLRFWRTTATQEQVVAPTPRSAHFLAVARAASVLRSLFETSRAMFLMITIPRCGSLCTRTLNAGLWTTSRIVGWAAMANALREAPSRNACSPIIAPLLTDATGLPLSSR